jgi:predicted DCC family thiol-disulfide oxidoreductase YuxK
LKHSIVFYDSACPLCSRVVRFILIHEKNDELRFSALQGKFAKSFLSNKGINEVDLSTFYLFKNEKLYQKSTAALRLLTYLKWYLLFLNIFGVLPRVIRDFFYMIISRNRYRIFKNRCDIGRLDPKRNLDVLN